MANVDIGELETVERKLSELSSLLEELLAYPGCSALDSSILDSVSGGNISTHHSGNMICSQASTIDVGDSIDQDIVDSFLNFPGDCEFLGPVLADHTHDELLNTCLWIDNSSLGFHQIPDSNALGKVEGSNGKTLLDAVVPDSYSCIDDAFNLSSAQDTCKSGVFGVGSSLPLACKIPESDSGNGNVDATAAALKSIMQPQKAASGSKRRAKPGGNHKSRPRDRQQIQDRVKELRELVPNGGKCSIDALLDKTVKHMLYLRSVTDQALLLKQWLKPGQKVEQYRTRTSSESKGSAKHDAHWDFECFVEQKACPIHVEDLAHPGHLLIEVLCNERVMFLEIANVIRGVELNILKGVMQNREDNTWAHFIVEVNLDKVHFLYSLLYQPFRLTSLHCTVTGLERISEARHILAFDAASASNEKSHL
ncbi:Transcription factor bHLH157 [Linum perenne]